MRATNTEAPEVTLTIEPKTGATVMDELNVAVAEVRRRAMVERQRGILVTREGYARFTISLSSSVPFGQTLEISR
jgi:hypothetical protein